MKKLDKNNIDELYGLTPLQEGMLFHHLSVPDSSLYFEQLTLDLGGPLDETLCRQAWQQVTDAHDTLRTCFRWEKVKHPIQVVLKKHPLDFRFHDFSSQSHEQSSQSLQHVIIQDRKTPFTLEEVPFRVTLCRIDSLRHHVIVSSHHILYDGWSNGILLSHFFTAYKALSAGKQPEKPQKTKFKQYIKWRQARDKNEQELFWKEYLDGFDTPSRFPHIESPTTASDESTGTVVLPSAPEFEEKLEQVVKKHRLTPAALFYGAWGILLQRYLNSDDVVFGTTVSGRSAAARYVDRLEHMVGLFINTLPLRLLTASSPVSKSPSIVTLLSDLQHTLQQREPFEPSSLADIEAWSPAGTTLFDSIVVMENYPLDRSVADGDHPLSIEGFDIEETTNYPLTLGIMMGDHIEITITYLKSKWASSSVERLVGHYKRILETIVLNPHIAVDDIDMLSSDEKRQLLETFNDSPKVEPASISLHRLFEEQVNRTPDRIALTGIQHHAPHLHTSLTYRELNRQSDCLAAHLHNIGTRPDTIVGLFAHRNIEMIIGILGILKAGAAYMPIDPNYPQDRISYILKDSGTQIVVRDGSPVQNDPSVDIHLEDMVSHIMDIATQFESSPGETRNAIPQPAPSHLAYIIYTSGSTGRPKGVAVMHQNALAYVAAFLTEFPLTQRDVMVQQASYAFDAFVEEMYPVLAQGGKLAIPQRETIMDMDAFASFIAKQSVTIITCSPLMLNELNRMAADHRFSAIHTFISGGDTLKNEHICHLLPLGRVYNTYGPTEATVCATYYRCTPEDTANIPIGKPIAGYRVHILDRKHRLMPPGIPGELCIAGPGVTRGYLNKPELTHSQFITSTPHPSHPSHLSHQSHRSYKTGDLACWLPDGNIQFLGRIDRQVSIRGFRIEPGEIEHLLSTHTAIKEAAVIQRNDSMGNPYLSAYLIPATGTGELSTAVIKEFLAGQIPQYMVPSYFTVLEAFPVNANGKLDIKALPSPESEEQAAYVAPVGPLEQALVESWADILGIDPGTIGRYSDFFHMGGHSLYAIRLVAAIHKQLEVKLPVTTLFQHPTLAGMASLIKEKQTAATDSSIPTPVVGKAAPASSYPLSGLQRAFYTLQQLKPDSTDLNIPLVFFLPRDAGDTNTQVEEEKITATVSHLIHRHESLRTSFRLEDEEPVQIIHENAEIPVQWFDLPTHQPGSSSEKDAIKKIIDGFVQPFDLSHPPLLRPAVIRRSDNLPIVLLDIHHIVSDGTSQDILLRDFLALYRGTPLPEPAIHYKDFAVWQKEQIRTGTMNPHKAYWLERLSGELPILDIPTDLIRPSVRTQEGDTLTESLDPEFSDKLRRWCEARGITLYMLLLTIYGILLSKLSGQTDIIVGTPVSGRTLAELENTVGPVLNSLMMRLRVDPALPVTALLQQVKTTTLEAFEHQDYPMEELLENLDYQGLPNRNPITDIALNVLNLYRQDSVTAMIGTDDAAPVLSSVHKRTSSKMDITLSAADTGKEIILDWEYRIHLFEKQGIQRLSNRFRHLLHQVFSNPARTTAELELISPEEKQAFMNPSSPCPPLSHPQRRIYYTEIRYPDTGCNSLAFTVRYQEELDKNILQQAIHAFIRQHEGLRLRIIQFAGAKEPFQYVAPYHPFQLEELDFRDSVNEAEMEKQLKQITAKPFSLINSDLYYFAYVRFKSGETGYYAKLHHFLFDGWSRAMLVEGINTLYRELQTNGTMEENDVPSYIDFIHEEQTYLSSQAAESDRQFWHQHLLPLPPPIPLSSSKSSVPVSDSDITSAVEVIPFPAEVRERMHQYCSEHRTSLYKLIFSALAIFLSRISFGRDVVITAAGHNRSTPRQKQMAGMFVSTLPIRVHVDEDIAFIDFVNGNNKTINHIVKERQRYPFDLLVEELRERTGEDTGYLLDIYLVGHPDMKEDHFKVRHVFPGSESSPLSPHINTDNRDISGVLEMAWDYRISRYTVEDIHNIHRGLTNILADALQDPTKAVGFVEWLSQEEKEQLLLQFNDTERSYPLEQTFIDLFRLQVAKTPDNPAVMSGITETVDGEATPYRNIITYRQLDARSDALAFLLHNKGVGSGTVVGIMTERSPDMISGVLGILKAGATYLPLDASYPPERLTYMLHDSNTQSVLIQPHLTNRLPVDIPIISMDQHSVEGANPDITTSGVSTEPSPADAAYIIYTSGSTGRPKGVMVTHRNFANAAFLWREEYHLDQMAVNLLQMAGFSFDVFCGDLARTLVNGGKMVICPENVRVDPLSLHALITHPEHRISLFESTPALVVPFMDYVYDNNLDLDCLELLILGSDICRMEDFKRLLSRFGNKMRIINSYGVTEATIDSSYYEEQHHNLPYLGYVPIGKPLPNTCFYILDRRMKLQPIGVAGELFIGGNGVARGYLNRPELTHDRFVEDIPHLSNRSYKTGDMARWLPDGNVDFLGRIDNQVKVRGFRIEMGEIENQLVLHPGISEAVVDVVKRGGDMYLYAYLVASNHDNPPDIQEIREQLVQSLPDYMVPGHFLWLERMPVTPNGKIDRNALANEGSRSFAIDGSNTNYVPPTSDTEKRIETIWQELLAMEKIGIDDNFFETGGHSLKAFAMISRLEQAFGLKVKLPVIYDAPTIRRLAIYVDNMTATGTEKDIRQINPAPIMESYPLTSPQKRLYLLDRMGDLGTAYNISSVVLLDGYPDPVTLESVFKHLINRHESLRTSFHENKGEPVQVIHPTVDFTVDYIDWHASDAMDYENDSTDEEWEKEKNKTNSNNTHNDDLGLKNGNSEVTLQTPIDTIIDGFIRPYDLSKPPLLRVGLIKQTEKRYILVVDMHHIISDGVSIGNLVRDFYQAYAGIAPLPELKLQYKDFAYWWNSREGTGDVESQGKYWLDRFKGTLSVLDLPYDFRLPIQRRFDGAVITFRPPDDIQQQLQELALETETGLFSLLLAVYNVFLYRLSNQEDIVVGTPAAGRRHPDLEPLVGMFVNTLALRHFPTPRKQFRQFLQDVKNNVVDALENQDFPFEELVNRLGLERDTARNPLFSTVFVLQDNEMTNSTGHIPSLPFELKPYNHQKKTTQFDIILQVFKTSQNLEFLMEYSTVLFKPGTMERFVGYYQSALSAILNNPDVELGKVEIVGPDERQKLLETFNNTDRQFPGELLYTDLFDQQVERSPHRIALTGNTRPRGAEKQTDMSPIFITYRELDQRARYLAGHLRNKGVTTGTIAAIKLLPSVEIVISMLAVMKAGAAYLPIDPRYPQERIDYILADSAVDVLITFSAEEGKDSTHWTGHQVCISTIMSDSAQSASVFDSDSALTPLTGPSAAVPAYIIYTSGTTGRPKGTVLTHRSLVNLCYWHNRWFGVTEADHATQFAGFGFDASVWEIFPYLITGAALYVIPEGMRLEIDKLCTYYRRHHISITFLPTQFCQSFMEEAGHLPSLRAILAGGDKLSRFEPGEYTLYNNYGPTESTVVATSYPVKQMVANIPIGKPIDNIKIYILHPQTLRLQPVGVAGELCISGAGLAAGYLNNPEMTMEKFITRNFNDKPVRLYRTGDLARWLADGNILFRGRIDKQVKIRGYRIEPAEIEKHLLTHPHLREVVVIARTEDGGGQQLCAYYVTEPGMRVPEGGDLKNHLSRLLPEYMIPAYFTAIDFLPVTPGGKVDTRALPEPDIKTTEVYAAPTDELESQLVTIWKTVLNIDKDIGIDDGFFELGGHSLNANRLVGEIYQQLDVKVPLAEVFKTASVRGLAAYIRAAGSDRYMPLTPAEKKDYYPLSYNQKRLWIIDQMNPGNPLYNIYGSINIDQKAEPTVIRKILYTLAERHESFRTRIDIKEEEPVQWIETKVDIPMEVVDLSKLDEESETKQASLASNNIARYSFDLSQAPLLRVLVLILSSNRFQLCFTMHHIISDGWSMDILKREFTTLYGIYGREPLDPGSDETKPFPLPPTLGLPLSIQYKDFAFRQNQHLKDLFIKEKALNYWSRNIGESFHPVQLPTDFLEVGKSREAGGYRFILHGAVYEHISRCAKEHNTSLFSVLLTVFCMTISEIADTRQVSLGILSAGREDIKLQNIVGYFVNTLLFITDIDGEVLFPDVLKRIKGEYSEMLRHQDYPLELVFEDLHQSFPELPLFFNMFETLDMDGNGLDCSNPDPAPYQPELDAKSDMTVHAISYPEGIECVCIYRKERFREETVAFIMKRYLDVLTAVAEDPNQPLSNYLLQKKKKRKLRKRVVKSNG